MKYFTFVFLLFLLPLTVRGEEYVVNVTATGVYLFPFGEDHTISFNGHILPLMGGLVKYFYVDVEKGKFTTDLKGLVKNGNSRSVQVINKNLIAPGCSFFYKKLSFEQNSYYVPYPLEGTSGIHWYWDYVFGGGWNYYRNFNVRFNINNLYCNNFSLPVTGYIYGFSPNLPGSFKLKVEINNHIFYTKTVTDMRYRSYPFELTCGDLTHNNTLTFTGTDTGKGGFWVDRIEIFYPSFFTPSEGKLSFNLSVSSCVSISPVHEGYFLLNVENRYNPIGITSGKIINGSLRVCLSPGRYFYQSLDSVNVPSSSLVNDIYPDFLPESDLLVITAPRFVSSPALSSWIERREKEGLSVLKIPVDEVYRWFSYGNKSPFAIRDFLLFLKSKWIDFPKYLLLVGFSTSAPRNDIVSPPGFQYLEGKWDLLPAFPYRSENEDPRYSGTIYEYYDIGVDYFYADPDNDGKVDFYTGRLPVTSETELSNIFNKVYSFEEKVKNDIVVINDSDSGGFDFSSFASSVTSFIPPNNLIFRIDLNNTTIGDAHEKLMNYFSSGGRLMMYLGHGFFTFWSYNYNEEPYSILSIAPFEGRYDLSQMQENDSPFIVFQITCFANSIYYEFYPGSLGRNLLINPTGASAAWGAVDYSDYSMQKLILPYVLHEFFDPANKRLGEAIFKGIENFLADHPDLKEGAATFPLLGDPSMNLWGRSLGGGSAQRELRGNIEGELVRSNTSKGNKSTWGCSSTGGGENFLFFLIVTGGIWIVLKRRLSSAS